MHGQSKKLARLAGLWAAGDLQTHADDDGATQEFDQALAAFGLQADESQDQPEPEVVYLWPCNLETWRLWQHLQTMWRMGMGGREGFDWASVTAWLRYAERMRPGKLARTLALLQAMEHAALVAWAEQRQIQANTPGG